MMRPNPALSDAFVTQSELDAGDFKDWLDQAQRGEPADVPCGACNACCRASYFIHVEPTERDAMDHIPPALLFPAPGRPPGHMLMGHDQTGACPMLDEDRCSIYEHRPQTCRDYDCRVFAAAGISAGGPQKAQVNAQVKRWRFLYRDSSDKRTHDAIRRAAEFLTDQAHRFEATLLPTNPTRHALLAIRIHHLFIDADAETPDQLATEISRIIRASESAGVI